MGGYFKRRNSRVEFWEVEGRYGGNFVELTCMVDRER